MAELNLARVQILALPRLPTELTRSLRARGATVSFIPTTGLVIKAIREMKPDLVISAIPDEQIQRHAKRFLLLQPQGGQKDLDKVLDVISGTKY